MRDRSEVLVLLVDDEAGIRETLAINLELDGFKTLSASSGSEAMELLKKHAIDFVISDIRMPRGDGITLLKDIKVLYPDIPHVVLISGFSEVSTDEVKKLGAIDLMLKPPDIDLLIELIKKYCDCA